MILDNLILHYECIVRFQFDIDILADLTIVEKYLVGEIHDEIQVLFGEVHDGIQIDYLDEQASLIQILPRFRHENDTHVE